MLNADPRERTRLVIAIILAGIGVAAFVGLGAGCVRRPPGTSGDHGSDPG
jgi:hypothetical protein